jgi:hypothetical protein
VASGGERFRTRRELAGGGAVWTVAGLVRGCGDARCCSLLPGPVIHSARSPTSRLIPCTSSGVDRSTARTGPSAPSVRSTQS